MSLTSATQRKTITAISTHGISGRSPKPSQMLSGWGRFFFDPLSPRRRPSGVHWPAYSMTAQTRDWSQSAPARSQHFFASET